MTTSSVVSAVGQPAGQLSLRSLWDQ